MPKEKLSCKTQDLPSLLAFDDITVWAKQFEGLNGRTLRQAARQIIQEYKQCLLTSDVDRLLMQLDKLVKAKIKESRMIAGFSLEKGIIRNQWDNEVMQWVYQLADDPEWDVREGAQLVLRAAMDYHFHSVLDVLQLWTHDHSPNIRRAALMACRPKPHSSPESARQMWKIIKPLMADKATYVYRNIPYVLGFWGYHPDLLLSSLLSLAKTSEDIIARKNILRVLNKQELIRLNPKKVGSILKILLADQRPVIQRSVQQILAQYPEELSK